MPRRPLRPCSEPGCTALTSSGTCTTHKRKRRRRYDDARGSASARGYGARHREWREAVLKRDPICRMCGAERSKHADHIVPVKRGGARFDLSNGQGLCHGCHNRKTARERSQ